MSLISAMKKSCCSLCGTPGHRINKCDDPSIAALIKEAEEVCIVSFAFYWLWNPKKTMDNRECIKAWLKEINPSELKILAYHFKTSQNKKSCLDSLPNKFYSEWVNPYDEVTVYNKMILFSDEKLKKWREFLCKNFYLAPDNVRNRFWDLCYPYHRFFIDMKHCEPFAPIDPECPICFGNLTQENAVKTGCNHELCKQCVAQYMRSESNEKNELSCPMCRTEIKKMSTSEKETFDILRVRFCKPIPPPPEKTNLDAPRNTPILVSQLVQQERATLERTKFYRKVAEALFWIFASAAVSSFITKVIKMCV
jgi:hypothetical protein